MLLVALTSALLYRTECQASLKSRRVAQMMRVRTRVRTLQPAPLLPSPPPATSDGTQVAAPAGMEALARLLSRARKLGCLKLQSCGLCSRRAAVLGYDSPRKHFGGDARTGASTVHRPTMCGAFENQPVRSAWLRLVFTAHPLCADWEMTVLGACSSGMQ